MADGKLIEIGIILTYFLIAILIFILSLRLGSLLRKYKHEYQPISSIEVDNSIGFNLVYRIIFTPIIIMILATTFYYTDAKYMLDNIWIISVFVALLQVSVLVAIARITLVNIGLYIVTLLLSISASVLVSEVIIPNGIEKMLPGIDDFRSAIYIGIITFFYGVIKNIPENKDSHDKRVRHYVIHRYRKMKRKYGKIIEGHCTEIRAVTYSVMIFEDYNRPAVVRLIEKIVHAKTTDITQTYNATNNREGIRKLANRLEYDAKKEKMINSGNIMEIVRNRNPDSHEYGRQIQKIYNEIMENEGEKSH